MGASDEVIGASDCVTLIGGAKKREVDALEGGLAARLRVAVGLLDDVRQFLEAWDVILAERAARAREQVDVALQRLDVPADLARDVACRLTYKVAERFVQGLQRLWSEDELGSPKRGGGTGALDDVRQLREARDVILAGRVALARERVAEALRRLDVPADLARDVSCRLSCKVAERFVQDLDRLWPGDELGSPKHGGGSGRYYCRNHGLEFATWSALKAHIGDFHRV